MNSPFSYNTPRPDTDRKRLTRLINDHSNSDSVEDNSTTLAATKHARLSNLKSSLKDNIDFFVNTTTFRNTTSTTDNSDRPIAVDNTE